MTPPRDPFDFDDDDDKTVIHPINPGGRLKPAGAAPSNGDAAEKTVVFGGAAAARQSATASSRPAAPSESQARAEIVSTTTQGMTAGETVGDNPLVAAAARLLALAGAVRGSAQFPAAAGLRQRAVEELSAFEKSAQRRGVDERETQLGHYVLCALFDDVVMATPWGRQFGWSERSLTSAFHQQVDAGDKLYTLATRLEQSPGQHPFLLELVYIALSLGFEGSLRLKADGPAHHTKVRDSLFQAVRQRRGSYERPLAGSWRGAETGFKPLARRIPLWVYWAGCGFVGLLIFMAFFLALDGKRRQALAPLESVSPAIVGAPSARFEQVAVNPAFIERVRNILASDIDAGVVQLVDDPGSITIRIISIEGSELFRSGGADVSPAFRDTIGRIAEAAGLAGDPVRVRGYSDSVNIATQRYRSNYELSAARAEAVSALIRQSVAGPISAEGRGPQEPVADNSTDAGRRLNRRVEVILAKPTPN